MSCWFEEPHTLVCQVGAPGVSSQSAQTRSTARNVTPSAQISDDIHKFRGRLRLGARYCASAR